MKKINLVGEWIKFAFTSKNAYGIHSPFVFDFYNIVIKGQLPPPSRTEFLQIQQKLLKDNTILNHKDLGAGSKINPSKTLTIKDIAKGSLKKEKEAGLIARTINLIHAKSIVELGTSLGTTSLLISLVNPESQIYTIEGSPEVAHKAQEIFNVYNKNNIQLITGSFEEKFVPLLSKLKKVDAFIFDGNHRKEATLNYFSQAMEYATNETIFIFDDIRWSMGMLEAWKIIENHPKTTLTMDFFSMGMAFINRDFSKQNLRIRY